MAILTPPGYRTSKLYGVFPVGRLILVKLRARTRDLGRFGYLDLDDDAIEIRLRFAPLPLVHPTVFDRNYLMEKIDGVTALAQVAVTLPTVRDRLHVEWVAVETDVPDLSTPSQKVEHALGLPWIARAVESPAP